MNGFIAKQIKELRIHHGYSQQELASLLQVGQTTIANYERGIREPDVAKLRVLANLFGISLDSLIGLQQTQKQVSPNQKQLQNVGLELLEFLLHGRKEEARSTVLKLAEEGHSLRDLFEKVMKPLLMEVGALWEMGKVDVWMEHYVSDVIQDIIRELVSKTKKKWQEVQPPVIVGFVPGAEQHTIGLKMISELLEQEGYDVVFLGANVPLISAIAAIERKKAKYVLLSVTLAQHLDTTKHVIDGIRNYFKDDAPKIMVGGNAFSSIHHPWSETGADYYGESIDDIVEMINSKTPMLRVSHQ